MRNLHALLRSKRIKCLFGIVYHLRKNNRLERLKMKNKKSLPISQPKATFSLPMSLTKRITNVKDTAKLKNFSQKTAESCGYFKILTTFAKMFKR